MRLSSYDTCVLYLALKNHFTSNYDYFKYNGKVKLAKDTFERRRDYYTFQKLSRKYGGEEMKDFLLANFVYRANETKWAGSLFEPEADEAYSRYMKEFHSLTYTFKTEIATLDLHSDFKGTDPNILNLFYGNHLSIFTMIILDDMIQYSATYNRTLQDNFLWAEISRRLEKFRPFFHYDRKKFSEILKEAL